MTSPPPPVGCIGAGVLGAAIMERLIDRGFPVAVWNRDRSKLAPLLERGAREAASPASLTAEAAFVITCVTDGNAVEQIVFGEDGVAATGSARRVLVDMSTSDAGQTRALAARLREACGMAWLDAPISGGAPAARAGRMTVMVGGSEADFERARPLWDALAGRVTHLGPTGAGQTTKMINQVLVACGFAVLAEACGLAELAGVDASRIAGALGGGRADSRLLQEMMPKMAASEFSIEGRMDVMIKDLEMIHALARGVGAPMPVTAAVAQIYRKMVLDGYGERDNTELVRYYRE